MAAEQRRVQIIESARRVFAANGYAGTRTRDIAAEAGINEAMLYRHFPSKEELFEASVLESIDAAMYKALDNAKEIERGLAGSEKQVDEAITQFISDLTDIAVDLGPLIGATAFGPDSPVRTKLIERLDALFNVATSITTAGIPDLIHDGIDIRRNHEKTFGAIWFTASMSRWLGREIDRKEIIDQLMQILYTGVVERPSDISAN
ncbi:MAG TPA: helix-turn-helix domain-containing protein [Aeromicrobium sp.]|nr:helix-turn-helix domain-containing protein [Aeromicrobium sp.]